MDVQMKKETGAQLTSIDEQKPLNHQQQINPRAASFANSRRLKSNRRNLPNRSLIAAQREMYFKFCVPLYEASVKCDWKAAKAILDKDPELVRYSITENGETALHVAASVKTNKHVEKFVKNLVDMMKEEDLELVNENSNTALYLAAAAGNIKTVRIMVEKNRGLLIIPGARGQMMPLYSAALYGNYEVVKYLYENSNELNDDGWNPQNRGWLLEKCVEADMFDVALQIVKKHPKLETGNLLGILARKPDAFSETNYNVTERSISSVVALVSLNVGVYEKESEALQLLKIVWEDIAKKPRLEIDEILRGSPDSIKQEEKLTSEKVVQTLQLQKLISELLDKLDVETQNIMRGPPNADQALQLQKLISEHLVNMHVETKNMIKQDKRPVSGKGDHALELQKLISDHIVSMHVNTQNILKRESGKKDQVRYLQKLVSKHIAKMRVASTLKETHSSRVLFIAAEMGNTKFLVELIRRYPDLMWKNNMLHLAGKSATKERLADVSGAALQMQRELLWFKEVRNMIPPSYRERKNKDGLTPRELFTEEHKELIVEGEKWMKGTASQCMVVAALIATIVFAAAFTIPGGYSQNYGIPIFYRKSIFVVFVVADAISLFLSSASILTFLSILTSRYAERDFVESLPTKLMLGLATLFLSITTMMITFSVSFFILYHKEMKWIPIFISVFAVTPVLLYVVLQYHLLVDVIRSTYGSRYLFKPGKQFLYYVNPRV
ncbi:putative ankyrin repeat-containing domain, PGG domain, ankyrin repeat-containing domain superfamily [Helianthus annuus]|nr:putative ankyrin repeat-containing domain, PGG domain, ankyrin repeat-containing domain superfamily [Helianthus annuus]KAJ0485746.1 putative ankyrin repeat-containing domain, PGG domain, ankyrin repeat-containing domain superfamily [Helianthus annuus]KAJ0656299.1 putative ankyrin repeat-containing domain, PGG domain, ankyrin repeat-containing domain superfamily [Helianthus annuus]